MQRIAAIVIMIGLLGACQSGANTPAPTTNALPTRVEVVPTAVENPDQATEVAQFEDLVAETLGETTPVPTVAVTEAPAVGDSEGGIAVIPLPGTLAAAEVQLSEPLGMFDYIDFYQESGRDGSTITARIYNNGDVEIQERLLRIDLTTIQGLDAALKEINFLGLAGNMLGATLGDNDYRYRVTVVYPQGARSIWSQDGFMPQEYRQVLGLIRRVIDSTLIAIN